MLDVDFELVHSNGEGAVAIGQALERYAAEFSASGEVAVVLPGFQFDASAPESLDGVSSKARLRGASAAILS
eukprot:3292448-Prymnesium_polylepis.1